MFQQKMIQPATLVGPQPWLPAYQILQPQLGVSMRRLLNNSSGGGGIASGPGGSDDGPPAINSLPLILDPDTGKSPYQT